jgi:hypothetical protein
VATSQPSSPVDVLRRWEDSGATWRVVSRTGGHLRIALITCTGDEEMDRLESDDPELLAFVGERTSSEE